MHPYQPSATWGNGPMADDIDRNSDGGVGGGGGGSKTKDASGAGKSTARSEPRKAAAGKAKGEAGGASLVRTLALSNFGDRPVFLEVRTNVMRAS